MATMRVLKKRFARNDEPGDNVEIGIGRFLLLCLGKLPTFLEDPFGTAL